ncbi:MAG TPA: DUF1854 domain-containing protein [Tepidisphaeraceae bacterium]|jgi:hypothetical protein|nr:DUF1854 domain-containing protein [Tepidisphaeraceae bacterium]
MIEFDLKPDRQGRLVLSRPGSEDVTDVRLRRAFPWSCPSRHISVRAKEGKEILLIDDLGALPADLRVTVVGCLSATSLIPKIHRVLHVDVRFGFQQWTVETDRGPADFRVQEREDIRFMPDGRFTVKDADGNLYELPSIGDLDEHSRRAIEAVV